MVKSANQLGLIHLNGNILCAIDCETSGSTPGYNDLLKVCFLPLDYKLDPWPAYAPFEMELKPKRPQNYNKNDTKTNRQLFLHACTYGIDPDRGADLFEEWYSKFNLADNKRISPLAHNWPHDLSFIIDWLGNKAVEHFIDARFRDTMTLALAINDRYDRLQEQIPFTRVALRNLCRFTNVENPHPHDPLSDCVATAEVYKRLLHF